MTPPDPEHPERATPMTRPPQTHPMSNHGSSRSWRRWKRSAGFAWAGLVTVWRTQPNFKIEVWAAVVANVLALLLRVNPVPILLSCALVLSLEAVNTALEALTDLASPEFHPLAKVAKDAAAGAVLIASIFSVLVGLAVLGPALWQLVAL